MSDTSSPSASSDSNESVTSATVSLKDMDEIKEEIGNYLDVTGDGSFATSGAIPSAVNPGLFLKGLGKVGLPLTDRDAKDIIQISREAPFGKGTEKFVDPSVRKTWEIDPQQIEFRNSQWPMTLQHVVGQTVEQLGVIGGESSVRADLHKLLLYEEGGFFKTHRDTEKVPGMFATLVIMLPSEHEGGEVVVQLRNDKRTLSNPRSNEFDYAYLAWYADVNHSIRPVTSGYRLVLTYNLIHRSGKLDESRPPTVLEDHKSTIKSALKAWKTRVEEDDDGAEELVYLFDHEYSEANFGLRYLKGEDQVRALHLHDACQEHCFDMFLAHFEHSKKETYCEVKDDQSWYLNKLFTPDGLCIAENLQIEKEAIVQEDPFDGESPDDEESEGWLGNEDASPTQFYRRSCLVVVPRQHFGSFLSRGTTLNVNDWTGALLRQMENNEDIEGAKDELLRICPLATNKKSLFFSDSHSLLRVALKLGLPSLVTSVMEKSSGGLSPDVFREFGRAMALRDINLWLPALSASVSSVSQLSYRLVAVRVFREAYQTEVALKGGPRNTSGKRDQLAANIKRCLADALWQKPKNGILEAGKVDHNLLVNEARSQGESFVLDVIRPICKMTIRNTAFVARVLSNLLDGTNEKWLSRLTVQEFTRDTLTVLAREISDHLTSKPLKESKTAFFQPIGTDFSCYLMHGISYTIGTYSYSMSWEALVKLLCYCEKLELFDCVPMLLQPLIDLSQSAGSIDLSSFLIPLLKALAVELPNIQQTLPHYHTLFQQVLQNYIIDCVGEKPLPQANSTWTRKGNEQDCSYSDKKTWKDCNLCKSLNEFLAAPDRYEWRYKAAEPGRKHIHRRLHGLDCSYFTDKDNGSPYTLVLRKTGESYQEELSNWHMRCNIAKSTFQSIGHEKLKIMLDEKYDIIMQQLSNATNSETPCLNRQPLTALAGSTQNRKRGYDDSKDRPAAKRRGEVEVIDLC